MYKACRQCSIEILFYNFVADSYFQLKVKLRRCVHTTENATPGVEQGILKADNQFGKVRKSPIKWHFFLLTPAIVARYRHGTPNRKSNRRRAGRLSCSRHSHQGYAWRYPVCPCLATWLSLLLIIPFLELTVSNVPPCDHPYICGFISRQRVHLAHFLLTV